MTLAMDTSARPMGEESKGTMRPAALWMLLRLPLVMVLAFVFRGLIVRGFEATVGIAGVVEQVIYLLSTATTRGLYWITAALLLVAATWAARRAVSERIRFWAPVILAGIIFTLSMRMTQRSQWIPLTLALTALFAVNTLPTRMIERLMNWRPLRWLLVIVPGVTELLLPRLWWAGLRRRAGTRGMGAAGWESMIMAILVITALSAVLLRGIVLVDLDRRLHANPTVQLLARGDFNCVELDPTGRYLFACGHDLNHLRRYDLQNPGAAPMESAEPLGHAQSFAYSPSAAEIYVLNADTNDLLYFDSTTLALKRSIQLPRISPGDARIVCDDQADRLVISSEADEQTGVPFVVVDRTSGQVVQTLEEEAGNLLLNPDHPWVYLSFFRRRSDLLLYDLNARRITKQVPADARSEKMAFWLKGDQLLVTSPMQGRIQRFAARDLTAQGPIKTVFAGRTVAVDQDRNLLLCGSLATNQLVVIDLNSGRRVASFYVGPWLRTISIDAPAAVAYVSSNGGLFRVAYAGRQ